MKRNTWSTMILLFVAFVVMLSTATATWSQDEAAKKPTLTAADCAKCHDKQPSDINANGSKHKAVGCQNCHTSHRPSSKNNIPVCSQCHQGKPHFEVKLACLNCHSNPHTPLSIKFPGPLTEPCLTCHTSQIKQLRENQSKHTLKNCTDCHGVHRQKPQCTQCHKPHSADITAADCKKCHKAHMPKAVTYAADTDSKYCAACHKKQFDTLVASKVKHSTFNCAFCHQDKHKMVPNCKDCHGEKHPAGIMAKYPKCGMCHKIAHDLNNWKSETEPAPAAAPKTKKKQH